MIKDFIAMIITCLALAIVLPVFAVWDLVTYIREEK